MNLSNEHIAGFYDVFSGQQIKTGVNIRHRTIFFQLKKSGLKKHHKVLEIGCGIGTLTSLLGKYLVKGSVHAVDISPESINIARQRLKKFSHVSFSVSDMSDYSSQLKFDFVVLPDVLEHIPLSMHPVIFKKISECTHEDSLVFIHIPSPHYQDFISANKPELQQIIDQSLSLDVISGPIYENGFYFHSLQTYGLAVEEGDYQRIVLKKNKKLTRLNYFSKSRLRFMEVCSRIRLLV